MPRLLLMYIPVFAVAAAWIAIGADQGNSHELPLQSIVGGHRLQPNEAELKAVGRPDVSASESDEINQMYGVLLRCAAHSCITEDSSMTTGKASQCDTSGPGYPASC